MTATLKSATATLMLAAAFTVTHGPARADAEFEAVAGIEAQPLNAIEAKAVQGKAFACGDFDGDGDLDLSDVFGTVFFNAGDNILYFDNLSIPSYPHIFPDWYAPYPVFCDTSTGLASGLLAYVGYFWPGGF